jgi:hypothetical protein
MIEIKYEYYDKESGCPQNWIKTTCPDDESTRVGSRSCVECRLNCGCNESIQTVKCRQDEVE